MAFYVSYPQMPDARWCTFFNSKLHLPSLGPHHNPVQIILEMHIVLSQFFCIALCPLQIEITMYTTLLLTVKWEGLHCKKINTGPILFVHFYNFMYIASKLNIHFDVLMRCIHLSFISLFLLQGNERSHGSESWYKEIGHVLEHRRDFEYFLHSFVGSLHLGASWMKQVSWLTP